MVLLKNLTKTSGILLSKNGIRQLCSSTLMSSQESNKGTFMIEPTSMKIQKFDPENMSSSEIPPIISRYSTQGFNIQGNKLYGSVAILPKSFYSWKVKSAEEITPQSLQLFTVAEPRVELLVVGTGLKIEQLSKEVKEYMKKHNIAMEVLDTPNACATFNLLLEEGRMTAAVLIPPSDIPLF